MTDAARRLILASGSKSRREMLHAAGVSFDIIPADIDEAQIKATMLSRDATCTGRDIAVALAVEKALAVSRAHPGAVVIGSDQVLALDERLFTKARTLAGARETLNALNGKTHELCSAVALVSDARITWQTVRVARMSMRRFSDSFLDSYLDAVGEPVLGSVGCYQLEGLGVQLFESMEGDYFTVLGMPLLPVLAQLRHEGLIAS